MISTEGKSIQPAVYQQWLAKPATQRLLALEEDWIHERIAQLYGEHLVYMGIDPSPKVLEQKRIRHTYYFSAPWAHDAQSADLVVQEAAWPLPERSVDVVVLQHSLELSQQPHQLIREASRCLVPNGYLMIVGFNPYSLWGTWRWARTFSTQLPWIMTPVSAWRVQDWLTLLDLKVEQQFSCLHLWPLKLPSALTSVRFDKVLAGQNWLLANAYIIMARKTMAGMTPIRSRFSSFRAPSFGLPMPAASRVNTQSPVPQQEHSL